MFEKNRKAFWALLKKVRLWQAVWVGLGTFLIFSFLYLAGAFWSFEDYCQALIVQQRVGRERDLSTLYVVKKDQTTSALLDKNPDRKEFASLFKN